MGLGWPASDASNVNAVHLSTLSDDEVLTIAGKLVDAFRVLLSGARELEVQLGTGRRITVRVNRDALEEEAIRRHLADELMLVRALKRARKIRAAESIAAVRAALELLIERMTSRA